MRIVEAATIIKYVRSLSGITRKELAALAGVSPSTVGRIERGELDPTWGTLSRILEATGYQINGNTVVSAGDPTAIIAARKLLESSVNATASQNQCKASGANELAERWVQRWRRAGWLTPKVSGSSSERGASNGKRSPERLIILAVNAGNASKLTRRKVVRRTVVAPNGWQNLVKQIGAAGFDYAVSGMAAAREDRSVVSTTDPVVYVDNPAEVAACLSLEEALPGRGVLLISASGDELVETEDYGGIRYVSRLQGILDAFAGPGREPDKAEDELRSLLAVNS